VRAVKPRAHALGYFMAPLTGLLTRGRIVSTYIANHWDGTLACPAKHAGARTRVQVILERLQFAEDGGNQFTHRRMNVHGALQHSVRSTRIHHVQDTVDRLIAAGTENGSSQDLF